MPFVGCHGNPQAWQLIFQDVIEQMLTACFYWAPEGRWVEMGRAVGDVSIHLSLEEKKNPPRLPFARLDEIVTMATARHAPCQWHGRKPCIYKTSKLREQSKEDFLAYGFKFLQMYKWLNYVLMNVISPLKFLPTILGLKVLPHENAASRFLGCSAFPGR